MIRFPVEIFEVPTLEKVDLSDNAFSHVPVDRIVASQGLNSLELRRCQNLSFPPENVRERGGAFTMLYIRDSHCLHSTVRLPSRGTFTTSCALFCRDQLIHNSLGMHARFLHSPVFSSSAATKLTYPKHPLGLSAGDTLWLTFISC